MLTQEEEMKANSSDSDAEDTGNGNATQRFLFRSLPKRVADRKAIVEEENYISLGMGLVIGLSGGDALDYPVW